MNGNNQPSTKKDVYTIVTDQISQSLKKGLFPGADLGMMELCQRTSLASGHTEALTCGS